MIFRRIALLAAALTLLALPGLVHAADTITVYKGESTSVKLTYQFSEIAVGNPKVADYLVRRHSAQGAEIIVNGKEVGLTNLIVWDVRGKKRQEFTVKVLVRDLADYMRQLKDLIGPAEGVRLRLAGDKILIEGRAVLLSDLEKINKLVGDSPLVINMVTLSPVTLKVLTGTIRKNLNEPSIKVYAVKDKIVLSGVVYSKDDAQRMLREAKLYYPHIVNLLEVRKSELAPGKGEMIQVTANFMEVNSSVIDAWGVQWTPQGAAGANATQTFGNTAQLSGAATAVLSDLMPKSSRATEHGGAKVLETSSISVRSGEKATFHSGGEIGVPVPQTGGGNTISWKKHGVILNVLPIAQGDKITLRVKVEVSVPTGTSPGGFINLSQSQLSTVQFCKSGDSLALGGLISQRDTKIFDKTPEASGSLYQLSKSEDFRKQRSQFVVFITPTILKGGAAEAHKELKGKVEDEFESYQEKKR